jgi:hypothetical protein
MDISKCDNKNCKIRRTCYRFTAPADEYLQSMILIEHEVKKPKDCDAYWRCEND